MVEVVAAGHPTKDEYAEDNGGLIGLCRAPAPTTMGWLVENEEDALEVDDRS